MAFTYFVVSAVVMLGQAPPAPPAPKARPARPPAAALAPLAELPRMDVDVRAALEAAQEIGRASCRERVSECVEISVVAVSIKKK